MIDKIHVTNQTFATPFSSMDDAKEAGAHACADAIEETGIRHTYGIGNVKDDYVVYIHPYNSFRHFYI